MELSINTRAARHKIFSGLGLLLITAFIGLFLSMPIPVVFKLGFLLLPGILLFSVLNPFWTLILFFLFRPEIELFQKAGLLKLFSASVIPFAFLVLTTSKGRFNFCWDRLKYFYAFILVSIISMVYSIDYPLSLYAVIKTFSYLSIFLLSFNLVQSREDGMKLLFCFPLAAIVPLSYGFYQKLSGQIYVLYASGLERFGSFFYFANPFARFLFIVFLACIPLLLSTTNKRKRYFLALILISSLFTMGLLGVRSVWILLVFSFLTIAYFLPQTRKYLMIIALILPLLLGGILVRGVAKIINPDIHKKYGETIYLRFAWWENTLTKVIPERPVLGFGVGAAKKVGVMGGVNNIAFGGTPHNDYLRILVETGIVGFIPYLLFLTSNMCLCYKDITSYKENRCFNVCAFTLFASFVITMLATAVFYETQFMWYLFSYLAITHKLNLLSELSHL